MFYGRKVPLIHSPTQTQYNFPFIFSFFFLLFWLGLEIILHPSQDFFFFLVIKILICLFKENWVNWNFIFIDIIKFSNHSQIKKKKIFLFAIQKRKMNRTCSMPLCHWHETNILFYIVHKRISNINMKRWKGIKYFSLFQNWAVWRTNSLLTYHLSSSKSFVPFLIVLMLCYGFFFNDSPTRISNMLLYQVTV